MFKAMFIVNRVICGNRLKVSLALPRNYSRPVRSSFDNALRCYECGERGHFSRDCRFNRSYNNYNNYNNNYNNRRFSRYLLFLSRFLNLR